MCILRLHVWAYYNYRYGWPHQCIKLPFYLQEEDHALSNDCLGVFCYVVAYALMAGQNLEIVFGAIWVFALDIRWLRMSLNLLVLIPFTTPGVQVGEKKIYNDKSTLYSLEPCRNRLAKARANTLAIGP